MSTESAISPLMLAQSSQVTNLTVHSCGIARNLFQGAVRNVNIQM